MLVVYRARTGYGDRPGEVWLCNAVCGVETGCGVLRKGGVLLGGNLHWESC